MDLISSAELFPREKYLKKIRGFYHECEIIKVITGVRRCGKSSLMKLMAAEIRAAGVPAENILYFNLDKRPFHKLSSAEELDALFEKHVSATEKTYLFIDEIQNVANFETVLNAWREEGNVSIFITGSNSYLLSGELATKLTGRYIEFNVLPLTFDEYLEMKKFLGKEVSTDSVAELKNYILEGGFPYAVRLDSLSDKRTYVRGLIDEIYKKDIQKRLKIKNKSVFDVVMLYIINNFGSTTSIQNIVDDLAKNKMTVKRETVNKYIEALKSAKILMECKRFDMKSRKSLSGEKKYYLSDLSFYFAYNTDNRINFGPTLENLLYTYAASQDYEISVGKIGNLECDFILRDRELSYAYVQVAYTVLENKKTEDREYKSLESIKGDNYPRYVMTMDPLLQKRNGISHVNIVDFMKSNEKF